MKLAVSACLLGEKVRFDKGHKRDEFITQNLAPFAEFVPFCPEHLAFGSPRASIRMVKEGEDVKLFSNKTGQEITSELLKTSVQELERLKNGEICGIIFKSKSPSCGLNSSKIYLSNGFAEGKGDGMFVSLCKEEFALLPMEEEGRLQDAWLRENFVMQIFAYERFEKLKSDASMKGLVLFHQHAKFMLQSKDEVLYRELGKVVANHEKKDFAKLLQEYEILYKTAIGKKSSIGKTRNVLEHMAGFVKNFLTPEEKSFLHEQIHDYANKILPLIVPLSTLKLYAAKYEVVYLQDQVFLEPYPKELALRSDIMSVK